VTKRPLSRLSGFTLIELIVVISIMAILSALIIAAVQGLTGKAKEKKTGVIIRAVETGIYLAVASRGSAISPAEHPFAGSRADAVGQFMRGDPRWSPNTPVSTSSTALKGVPNPSYLGGVEPGNLMMPSDIYKEIKVPILYGAKREDIGVLQSLRKVVTKYRMLPMPPSGQTTVLSPVTGAVASSYQGDANTDFPDTLIPTTGQIADVTFGTLADAKSALDYLFGSSSAQAELSALKALYNADPTLPNSVNKFTVGIEPRTAGGANPQEMLAYTDAENGIDPDTKTIVNKWKPGYISVSSKSGTPPKRTLAAGSTWVRYRLAGLAVYDAWDNELFVTIGANDKYRVLSAGADGVLAVNPGKDNAFGSLTVDTTSGDLKLTGDDTDGAKDNVK
jgi:prepilin-type N-terminal cleavage/methylation domain-containing protein